MNMIGRAKRQWSLRASILAGLLVASVALVPFLGSHTVAQTPSRPGASNGDRYLFSDLAEQVIPSVVTVYVKRDMRKEMDPQTLERLKEFQKQYKNDPFLRQLIPFNVPGAPNPNGDEDNGAGPAPDESDQWITKGSGSGVIISAEGYVVTNWHVVGDRKNNPEIRVVLSDNTELSGKDVQLVESSKLADLALLKINRKGLKPISFGDSEKIRIGEWIAAIGSPLDMRLTVTQGIICAKHREIDSAAGLGSLLQTDAVINPGSSGGALVNLDGQLIGINRLITTPFQGREAWSGYGFAIPANDVKQFVDTVLKTGKITYGYIGVGVANEFTDSPKLREALNFNKDQKGALVIKITPGTPAANAGLQEGDMIVAGDGKPITNYNDLIGMVARREVGSTIKMSVLRPQENDKPREVTVSVRVAERPSEDQLDQIQRGEKAVPQPKPQVREENNLGVRVEPYSEGGRQGVKILEVQPGSPAARAGLQADDVIYEINFKPIKTAQDINKALKGRSDRSHLIRFLRDGNPGLVAIDQNNLGKDGKKR